MEIKCATSFDERFDPKNVLDENIKTFWVTTGLYPHEILIDLGEPRKVKEIKFKTIGAKKIVIEGCNLKKAGAQSLKMIG